MSRPITAVHVDIARFVFEASRHQSSESALSWLSSLAECLDKNDPAINEYGAHLLSLARTEGVAWELLRQAVFRRDGLTCQYCMRSTDRPHCDHVIPKSKGGPDEMGNLKTACAQCNQHKGARTPEEWRGA